MGTNCVEMTLYFTPINGGETQTETVYNYEYTKSGFLAWSFGCYYLQGDEIDYIDNSVWDLPYWPDNEEQCKFKYQRVFQHDIDFTQYTYRVSFFDAEHYPPETPQPPKPPVLVKPTLTVTLVWNKKNSYEKCGEEKIILRNVNHSSFVDNLGLYGGEVWTPLDYYYLDGWMDKPQDYYLSNLYRNYGNFITHQYDDNKYQYSIILEPYEN